MLMKNIDESLKNALSDTSYHYMWSNQLAVVW